MNKKAFVSHAGRFHPAMVVPALICLLLGCDNSSQHSPAKSKIGVVGLRTSKMNYSAAQQRERNWCWAASIQMALSAKGIDVSQEEVVQNAFGRLVDRPGAPGDILANLNGWAIDRAKRRIHISGEVGLGRPSFELLKRQLEAGTPVIVGYENPDSNIGHAVVVTAVVYEVTDRGPEIQRVMVRDPWPTCPNLGKRELSIQEFNRVSVFYVIGATSS
jgi:hypothetical protein